MSDRKLRICCFCMIPVWIIIISSVLWCHISVDNYTKYCSDLLKDGLILKQQQTCNAFCNCSITQDCPYTFDYNEVKGCECDK